MGAEEDVVGADIARRSVSRSAGGDGEVGVAGVARSGASRRCCRVRMVPTAGLKLRLEQATPIGVRMVANIFGTEASEGTEAANFPSP